MGAQGNRGDRGPPLLESRGHRLRGDRPRRLADLKEWRIVEGGSTITQQLVRNLYIGHNRTFGRKLKEVCLAMKLGDAWTKRRILKTYMNQVYYGNHAYGVEAAAETYYSQARPEPDAAAGRADRGPAAGAELLRPVLPPAHRAGAP